MTGWPLTCGEVKHVESLPVAGVHAMDNYFLVVGLRVKQGCLLRSCGLHPLRHLRVTVGHLEGLRGYRLPVWEALARRAGPGQWVAGKQGEGKARAWAHLARPRVGKACVVALERRSAEDLVNVAEGVHTDS